MCGLLFRHCFSLSPLKISLTTTLRLLLLLLPSIDSIFFLRSNFILSCDKVTQYFFPFSSCKRSKKNEKLTCINVYLNILSTTARSNTIFVSLLSFSRSFALQIRLWNAISAYSIHEYVCCVLSPLGKTPEMKT